MQGPWRSMSMSSLSQSQCWLCFTDIYKQINVCMHAWSQQQQLPNVPFQVRSFSSHHTTTHQEAGVGIVQAREVRSTQATMSIRCCRPTSDADLHSGVPRPDIVIAIVLDDFQAWRVLTATPPTHCLMKPGTGIWQRSPWSDHAEKQK